MKIKLSLPAFLFFMPIAFSLAQPKIEFEKTIHDFGEIAEGDPAKYEFVFTNTGDQPLVITRVSASCGCTTPTWKSEPVLPGQKGTIGAGYNSQGRPGPFTKSIAVLTNAQNQYVQLFIKGTVIRKPATPPTVEQLRNSPKIAIENPFLNAGKIEKGQRVPLVIVVYNQGISDLRILDIKSPCNCLHWIRKTNEPVKSGEKQELQLVYLPISLGTKKDEAIIYSNDLNNPQIKATISAEVVESLEPQSPMRKNTMAF